MPPRPRSAANPSNTATMVLDIPGGRDDSMFILGGVGLFLVWSTLLIRVYVRAHLLRSWGWDDWMMTCAVVCFCVMAGGMFSLAKNHFGSPAYTLPIPTLIELFKVHHTSNCSPQQSLTKPGHHCCRTRLRRNINVRISPPTCMKTAAHHHQVLPSLYLLFLPPPDPCDVAHLDDPGPDGHHHCLLNRLLLHPAQPMHPDILLLDQLHRQNDGHLPLHTRGPHHDLRPQLHLRRRRLDAQQPPPLHHHPLRHELANQSHRSLPPRSWCSVRQSIIPPFHPIPSPLLPTPHQHPPKTNPTPPTAPASASSSASSPSSPSPPPTQPSRSPQPSPSGPRSRRRSA